MNGRTKGGKCGTYGMILMPLVVLVAFVLLGVNLASAAHSINATLQNNTNRIVPTGSVAASLTLVVNSSGTSTHDITLVNVTNATGYTIDTFTPPTGWDCTVGGKVSNCTNTTSTGTGIAPGGFNTFYFTVTTPGTGTSDVKTFAINTSDTANAAGNADAHVLALDNGDVGVDVRDELGFVLTGVNVSLSDAGAGLTITKNTITDGNGTNDVGNDGLVIFDQGDEIPVGGDSTFKYNGTLDGFIDTVSATTSYYTGGYNAFKISMPYNIKVRVEDGFGNVLTGAIVNITMNQTGYKNSTTQPNRTTVNGWYLFALRTRGPANGNNHYTNVTIIVDRTGYMTNGSIAGTYYLLNTTLREDAFNPVTLRYSLKINITDELGQDLSGSGVDVCLNTTKTTPAVVRSGFMYFNFSDTSVNVTVNKTGYINTTHYQVHDVLLNNTTQPSRNIVMPFSLKVGINNELGSQLASPLALFQLNNTTTMVANRTIDGYKYFTQDNSRDASLTDVIAINASYSGFLHNYSELITINTTKQALKNFSMIYTIKVDSICDELNNSCFTISGAAGTASAEVAGLNTTYSGSVGYIPAPGGSAVTVRGGRSTFLNSTKTFVPNVTTRARVVFNTSDGYADTQNGTGLQFPVRVIGVWDEFGRFAFKVNGAEVRVGGNATDFGINATYNGGYGYLNYTNVTHEITAVRVGGSFVNVSVNVTPATSYATPVTVLFNATNTVGATTLTGGLPYTLKLTVIDELSAGTNLDSGLIFQWNQTQYTYNTSSSNVYYFVNATNAVNISASRSGYINVSLNESVINSTRQAILNLTMPFAIRLNLTDEIGGHQSMGSGVTIALNGTTATPNSTSGTGYYFALANAIYGRVNISIAKSGYVTSTYNATLFNASLQAFPLIKLNFTIKVMQIRDELNNTDFTINGTNTIYSAFADVSGVKSNYSTYGYIAAPAGSATVVAGAKGYANMSKVVTAFAANQTIVVFNQSAGEACVAPDGIACSNGGGLKYAIRVMDACDELNKTCFILNGNLTVVGQGGVETNNTGPSDGSGIDGIYYNVTGDAYIVATGTVVNVSAFSNGYINRTQTITLTPASAQVLVYFNGTYPLKFAAKVTMQNELGTTTDMNTGIALFSNSTRIMENISFWRSASTSNIYYINVSTSGYNFTAGKTGYINTSANETVVNATEQALRTIKLPFSVKITVLAQNGELMNGSILTITDSSLTSPSVTIATDGASTDYDSTANGVIYYPLNKTKVTNPVKFDIVVGNFKYNGVAVNTITDTAQTAMSLPTDARRPYNFTTYLLSALSTSGTWGTFWLPTQNILSTKNYTAVSTNYWNISTVMDIGGMGSSYDAVYYNTDGTSTGWKVFLRSDWAGSTLQYVNNTNSNPYWANMTSTVWFIL